MAEDAVGAADREGGEDEGGDDGGRPGLRELALHEYLAAESPRKSLRRLPRLLARSIGLVWSAGRREFLVVAAAQVVQGVAVAAQLLIGKWALDAVLRGGEGASGFAAVLPALLALIAMTVVLGLTGAVQGERRRLLTELVARQASGRVIDVGTAVELSAFESPEFFDRLQRAQVGGQMRPFQMVDGLVTVASSALTATGIVAALAVLHPVLAPVALFAYVPLCLAAGRNSRDIYRFFHGMTANDRERAYLQRVLLGRDEAKEVRAFRLAPYLRRRYERLWDERLAELRRVARRRVVRQVLAALASAALGGASMILLAWLYVRGSLSLAAAAAALVAFLQLRFRLQGVMHGATGLYESALFVEDYTSFLDLLPEVEAARPRDPAPAGFRRLVVEGVSFTYPGATRAALRDVSMEVAAGEVVALVGENGSGKTTLAKLLARLYEPASGRILWDGADTGTIDPDGLRGSISLIFQDFVRYLLPARENIGAGRHERADDLDAVREAALAADADGFLARLPDGYETVLGKEFMGGHDLSVGQWQRVALARAFFRDAPFVILDEPTAALDPRAEHELFLRIRSLFEGRSVLLISHRFSSVRAADRIYVLHRGRVVEHGSHEELMARGGRYRDLFTLQAEAYAGAGEGQTAAT